MKPYANPRTSRWPAVAALLFVLLQVGCDRADDKQYGWSPTQTNPAIGAGTGAPPPGAGMGATAGGPPPAAAAGAGAGTGAAGMPAPAGTGGTSGTGQAGTMPPPSIDAGMMMDGSVAEPPPREDLGEGDGSDVLTIGDSWMSLGTIGIQQSLVRVSGQPYRTRGRGGTRLLDGVIPRQYTTAKQEDPDIKTVVMTGGGNDIIQVPGLRADCDAGGEMCAMVVGQILEALATLWEQMAADGVQDVIYVEYSNPEGNNVDWALPNGDGVEPRCAAVPAPLRCHTLPTLDIVMGDIPDGIHPSSAAYDRIGQAVYDMMVERGMRR